MKAYTDIEQSKILAEILPLESADMHYVLIDTDKNKYSAGLGKYIGILPHYPCWSLAALLDIIPYPTLGKHADETWSCASWIEKVNPYFVEGCDSPINACYEMIIKLHELNLF